jgi:hypothetical protein
MKRICCDVCGHSSDYPMSKDKKLKSMFGYEVDICLDCSAHLDDQEIYERLRDNEVIDDYMLEVLLSDEEGDFSYA